jgi:D-lactate dehydrogenase (cytochrome)
VARPRTEAEVAAIVTHASRVLPIGAQSSLTGGATPMGDTVLDTRHLDRVLAITGDLVTVQTGVPIAVLEAVLEREGLLYPPVPTFDGAFAGGVVATNAAGAATFKYGSTRDWVRRLTVVLAAGDVLDITRGEIMAHPDGYFDLVTSTGSTRVPVPTYRMPAVDKCSAGYFAEPEMDLIDLFIGSEGTLGIITEVDLAVVTPRPRLAMAWVPMADEDRALGLATALRGAALATWREDDPHGIDVAAIEHLDRRSLALLREDGADRRLQVTVPTGANVALLVHVELPAGVAATSEAAFLEIGNALGPTAADSPLVRLARLFSDAGVLDDVELALPTEPRRQTALAALREAVPAGVNRRIGEARRTVDDTIEKTAADMIVPFDRFAESLAIFRKAFETRNLDYAIWGHVSDGNVHPNVIPRTAEDVRLGREAILDCGREIISLGGCPLAEHGVGRNPTKQALLRELYGPRGIDEMRAVKRALDPQHRLSPGVLFPSETSP